MQRLNIHKYHHVLKLNKLDKTIIMNHDKYILSFQVLFDFRHSIKLNLSARKCLLIEYLFSYSIMESLYEFNSNTNHIKP